MPRSISRLRVRCLAISRPGQIASSAHLVAKFILVLLLLHPSWAVASGGTCSLKNLSSFGNTVIDIVANNATYTTSQVEYTCNSPLKFNNIKFCTYIRPVDNNSDNNTSNIFYQRLGQKNQLAWQLKLANDQNIPLSKYGGVGVTAGWNHSVNRLLANQSTIASQKLILSYLGRQQQGRVGSGTYIGTYQLVTQYKFNHGISSTCGSAIADPDGTIITNFNVSTTVEKKCQLENFQDVEFGNLRGTDLAYNGNHVAAAYGNIGIRCTYQTPYKISLNAGNNSENGTPRMKNDKNFLPYRLLQEGCKTAWDDKNFLAGNGNTVNAINNHQVCTQIVTSLTTAPAIGNYTDTVIVTATF